MSGSCTYCGRDFSAANPRTVEHLVPMARGGSRCDPENRGESCAECNAAKGTMTDEEFRAQLRNEAFFDHARPAIKPAMTDPVERTIAEALDRAGIEWVGDTDPRAKRLDFFLPIENVHIEVKRFHTDRTAEQMERSENIIVVVGLAAARAFARMITKRDDG
ncbi:HNH endonuclease [Rhodobacter capsulatus]|uniref:HNH endonuclease n=1 Tax=Rhodobacter capsulatus TaxID=1061 RepID=A0A4V5PP31_RHOCA|nr:HNH endonuclease [Rhodobacter capsulatus]TKD17939.1 HNH endonuclease [Rhodobacter capsulatus]